MVDGADKLKRSIEGLREKLFTIEEYPFLDRQRLPSGILELVLCADQADLTKVAAGIKAHEMEALILDYRGIKKPEDRERIIKVLAMRFSERLFKLLMSIYQYDYEAQIWTSLWTAMIVEAKSRDLYPASGSYIFQFRNREDEFKEIELHINDHNKDMDEFFSAFHINNNSPLAEKIKVDYLISSDHEGLVKNSRHLLHIIQNMAASELFDIVSNYLKDFTQDDYMDGINLAILEKLGEPYLSPEWSIYSLEMRDSFAQWKFSYQLRLRSYNFPQKHELLIKYYKSVRNSYEIDNGRVMVIDFGEIIIADIIDKPYSLFYYKREFELAMQDWQNPNIAKEPAFIGHDKSTVSARDYIIEEKEEGCMQLSYEGVGVLYIKDLLDIKMGLEPDVRGRRKR